MRQSFVNACGLFWPACLFFSFSKANPCSPAGVDLIHLSRFITWLEQAIPLLVVPIKYLLGCLLHQPSRDSQALRIVMADISMCIAKVIQLNVWMQVQPRQENVPSKEPRLQAYAKLWKCRHGMKIQPSRRQVFE